LSRLPFSFWILLGGVGIHVEQRHIFQLVSDAPGQELRQALARRQLEAIAPLVIDVGGEGRFPVKMLPPTAISRSMK